MLLQQEFKWTKDASEAYEQIKNALISPQVLTPYDPSLPLILATDASKTGLGAVMSHRFPNGLERPIAYASRTLTSTELKYPQIDKEALAIVWAVKKFFKYLYAINFTLVTDHKPLSQILHPEKSLSSLCISRMANYADFLSNFNYKIICKPTKANANADYCSRIMQTTNILQVNTNLVAIDASMDPGDEFDEFVIRQIKQLPIKASHIALETKKDQHLGKIVQLLESGHCLRRAGYAAPEENYQLSSGCLTFEHRVVVPSVLREKILKDLHAAHLGIVKMKGMARSFVYWPLIDRDIGKVAKACNACAMIANKPTKFGEHHWEYPSGPWQRIHIDYAGPFLDSMFLIVTDAFSKWMEVKMTSTSTSSATISILDEMFSTYGVPKTVVSDNATNFSSEEFRQFLKNSGVVYHKQSAPYHPAANGQVERCVQTRCVRIGDLHYQIEYGGKLLKRHIDQIRSAKFNTLHTGNNSRVPQRPKPSTMCRTSTPMVGQMPRRNSNNVVLHSTPTGESGRNEDSSDSQQTNEQLIEVDQEISEVENSTPTGRRIPTPVIVPRRSTRQRKPRVLFSP
ncbi:uncharacterized protein K02A2.6-like [Musca vetustissima]|uniref:uncharacterized protein K02A2.6-like n=1 Tax=Musca vetustissima TaxID=27455 RepID=UPI002AB73043|nr:uncharacterized protein K02A2.6-like [Musca vetustissima]